MKIVYGSYFVTTLYKTEITESYNKRKRKKKKKSQNKLNSY